MQCAYKMQSVSMVSGDVDVTLLRDLFNLEEGTVCFNLFLLADWLFYKLCQAGVFPKLGVTLPLSVTASSSLGSSWC